MPWEKKCKLRTQPEIILLYDNETFSAQIEYIFRLIFSVYGINCYIIPFNSVEYNDDLLDKLVISYGKEYLSVEAGRQLHIYTSDFFGENYLKPESLPGVPLRRYADLPVLYSGHGKFDGFVRDSNSLIETNIDIIASCFFMLSRYEEVLQDTRDQHDRFPAHASLAYQKNFLDRPIVNEYIELLWNWIHSLAPDIKRKPLWPYGKEFAVCISHDVDAVRRYSWFPPVSTMADLALKQKQLRKACALGIDFLAARLRLRKGSYDTFDYMMDMEQKNGISSSFYFMAGSDAQCALRYSITQPQMQQLIHQIGDRGCEVGLHSSYLSYNNPDRMMLEKDNLDGVVMDKHYGCRQHYLRWRTPVTWRIQEQAGILYDTTLTFADYAGFRCGYCLPFQPFDLLANRKLNIWEVPLIVMEGTLQAEQYQNLTPDEAYEYIMQLFKAVHNVSGIFTLLWHNSSFDAVNRWVGWRQVYEKTIEYIGCQNAWAVPGRELVDWWSQRTKSIL